MTPGGVVLDTWYPAPALGAADATGTTQLGTLEVEGELGPEFGWLVRLDEARGVEVIGVRTTIADLSAPPVDAHDV